MTTTAQLSYPEADRTPTLLRLGMFAGPLYVLIGLLEVLFRSGFDIRRHALSLMSNGGLGWIQIGSFICSGVMVILGAIGLRRALYPTRGATAGALLLAVYGIGLIGAGIFVADPMDGFPPGTPPGPPASMSWHGPLHFMAGGIGFFGLIGATLVFAFRFLRQRESRWAVASLLTGLYFFGAFAAIASGTRHPAINLAFTAAVIVSWAWLTGLFAKVRSELSEP
ncbi:MAG TPA: DUF998 domain-containing protein [Gemmatimonadales bacterium]|nr:DUF998 domain-containing protein [Gemmatimonadales bacterium]